MHSPMTEVDGMWSVEILDASDHKISYGAFHTREQASQWICKTLQSLPAKVRELVDYYKITFTVLGRATTPVPGLPGSYQAVQRHPSDDAGRGQ